MTAWTTQVITNDPGVWVSNLLVFATREEAEGFIRDLAQRRTTIKFWRAVESDMPVNYRWDWWTGLQPIPVSGIVSSAPASLEGV